MGSSFCAEELRACVVFPEAAPLPVAVSVEAAPMPFLFDARSVLVDDIVNTHQFCAELLFLFSPILKNRCRTPQKHNHGKANSQKHNKKIEPPKSTLKSQKYKKNARNPPEVQLSLCKLLPCTFGSTIKNAALSRGRYAAEWAGEYLLVIL
jgi:hypothetical protein